LLLNVEIPVTPSVPPSVVAPETSNVADIAALPKTLRVPVPFNGERIIFPVVSPPIVNVLFSVV